VILIQIVWISHKLIRIKGSHGIWVKKSHMEVYTVKTGVTFRVMCFDTYYGTETVPQQVSFQNLKVSV
jgi:hypothetical protein